MKPLSCKKVSSSRCRRVSARANIPAHSDFSRCIEGSFKVYPLFMAESGDNPLTKATWTTANFRRSVHEDRSLLRSFSEPGFTWGICYTIVDCD